MELTSLSVRSDIRGYTVYICRRCGVQSGSPDGRCDAARSDLTDPAARLNLHDFEPVEFVPGVNFLKVEAERDFYRKLYEKVDGELTVAIRDAAALERELDSLRCSATGEAEK